MTILCPYCASAGTNSWLRLSEYEAHKLKAHPEQIERLALLSMTTAQEQVEYIYEHHPETKQDNGLLLLRFAQGYPQLTLTEAEDLYILKAPYNSFFYFLKRANSITRLGRHLRQPKLTGETLSYSSPALKTGIKATEAVKKVLDEVPQARYNEGILTERCLRYFQPQGIEMQYDKETQEITLKAPKQLMLAVLRHIETIARRSREYREVHPYAEGTKAAERGIEYAFSTKEWATRSSNDALPNTYVPMRD